MRGAKLLVLLSTLWSGATGLNHTKHSWTTPEAEGSQKDATSASVAPKTTQGLQMLPATHSLSAEGAATPVARPSGQSLLWPARGPSGTSTLPQGVRSQTLAPTGKTEEGDEKFQTPASQNKSSIKFGPRAETVVLSNSTLKFLQSFSRKPDQQASSPPPAGGVGNRTPRGTYLSRGDGSGSQQPSYQKSSFETTRGKNWCAYVHTRLSPTVILDNQVTSYVSSGRGPCGWTSGSCTQRSQKRTNPVYRLQHKIVTSLEWRCCPGYSGPKCQLTDSSSVLRRGVVYQNPGAFPPGILFHCALSCYTYTSVALHTIKTLVVTVPRSSPAARLKVTQQLTEELPSSRSNSSSKTVVTQVVDSVMQKMTDQINRQAMKVTLLQKKVDNVSLAVDDVRNTYTSLEGKISEDKGREFQSFLKGLKSKSINDLVKEIVREQFKVFQNDMQETVAQLFKTVSSLSEDLENTRQLIRQVNESVVSIKVQQKSVLMQENRPTLTDLADLKNHIINIRQEMSFTCEKPIKELEAKQTRLESTLEQEHSRDILYYRSLNETLSKMKEVHEQLLPTNHASDQNVTVAESINNNATKSMSVLHEKISKQGLMLRQMFDDLRIQDNRINNLTISLAKEKESVRGECENILSKCRSDFKFQLQNTEENLHVLNQTLAEFLFPMDTKMDKMSEQLNDLTYDMEILQPLLEQGPSLRQTITQEQPRETAVTRKKVENLTSAVNNLNFLIRELTRRHSLLRNEVQSRGAAFERRINDYAMEMEDGLNKTMTIINNAIDFVQDNYVLKETFSTAKYNPEVHDKCNQKMETILTFIPQFQRLNDSIQILANDNQRYNFVLQVAKALANTPKDQKLSQFNFEKIYQMFNETTLQVKECQQNMSHLEENMLSATKSSKNVETQLQGLEAKVSQTLIPYYISLKKGNVITNERDQTLQLQVLSSRFKALEAKSIHLSTSFSLLNNTVHEFLTCHNASTSTSQLNATTPKWMKGSVVESQLPQKGLTEFVESIIERKSETALSNLTWYIDRLLSDSLANVVKSQKQVKLQKKPNTLKKPTVNLTTVLIGRAQRHTDNVIYPGTPEHSGCSRSPCQNGGTCIDGGTHFTCACRHPFAGDNCTVRLVEENALAPDFSKGSYRYAPMVAFFASHTYGMTTPGPILFNNLDVNYGASYNPRSGKFRIPYLGVYVFKYTIESFSAHISGFLVVDGIDKLAFESENINSEIYCDRVLNGDALLELNYGQEVWLRLVTGTIPAKFPPVTTFSGYLLYRT